MPFALARRVLATRAAPSIVSSPTSCAKVEISPVAMELVESPSTERSKTKQSYHYNSGCSLHVLVLEICLIYG